jgi:hypothetical protein
LREGLIDQLIKLVVDAIQGCAQGRAGSASLLVNMAMAGRDIRASRRENSLATFQP